MNTPASGPSDPAGPETINNPIVAKEADLEIIDAGTVRFEGVTYTRKGAATERTWSGSIRLRPTDEPFSEYDAMFERRAQEGQRCLTVPDFSHFHGAPTPCVFIEKPEPAAIVIDRSLGEDVMQALG